MPNSILALRALPLPRPAFVCPAMPRIHRPKVLRQQQSAGLLIHSNAHNNNNSSSLCCPDVRAHSASCCSQPSGDQNSEKHDHQHHDHHHGQDHGHTHFPDCGLTRTLQKLKIVALVESMQHSGKVTLISVCCFLVSLFFSCQPVIRWVLPSLSSAVSVRK